MAAGVRFVFSRRVPNGLDVAWISCRVCRFANKARKFSGPGPIHQSLKAKTRALNVTKQVCLEHQVSGSRIRRHPASGRGKQLRLQNGLDFIQNSDPWMGKLLAGRAKSGGVGMAWSRPLREISAMQRHESMP